MKIIKTFYLRNLVTYIIFCCVLIFLAIGISNAEIIIYENFDGDEWAAVNNCSDGSPGGGLWTWIDMGAGCVTKTYNGKTHYAGEVSFPGRGGSGRSLKQWRHTGSDFLGYDGYLNSTVASNAYRDLYQRYYMKWPNGFTVPTGVGTKFNRMYIGTDENPHVGQISVIAEGPLNDNGHFYIYMPGMSTNYTWFKTQTFSELGVNDGNWHCIEYHYRINTSGKADGEFEMWIDGYMIPLKYDSYPDKWTPSGESTPGEKVYGEDAGLGVYDISGAPSDFYYTKPIDPGIGNTGGGSSPYVCTPDEWLAIEFDDYVVSTAYIGPDNNLLLETTPPSISITSPTGGQTVSGTVLISADASDNIGVEGVTFKVDGIGVEAEDTASPYSIYLDTTTFSDGSHTLTATARDAAGNQATSDLVIVTFNNGNNEYNQILLEDWENNSINNWDDDLIIGDSHIDTDPVYGGNYAIKMESSNPGNYVHFFADHPGVGGDMVTDVTVEEYYYLSLGFQFPSIGMKLWVMNCFESWGAGYNFAAGQPKPHTWAPYYMSISVYGDGQLYGNLTRADGLGGTGDLWHNYQQNVGSAVALKPGSWNKIKFRLKLNSLGNSDGIFQLWVNDELKCNYFNLNYRGTYADLGWNHLMMSMHANPSHPQSQWISRDNIFIFSGLESAPSVPSAPSSLIVISE